MIPDIDRWLFIVINQHCTWSLLDVTMPIVTSFHWWIPVFVVGILWLSIAGGLRGRLCAIILVVSVVFADLATNRVIKPLIGRERPCRTIPNVVLRIPCAEGPSFPSSHAVNMAVISVVLSSSYYRWWWLWWISAMVVGFSRVYVGVHYPGDVLVGWLWGSLIGGFFIYLAKWTKITSRSCKKNGLCGGVW